MMDTKTILKHLASGPGLIDTMCDFIIRPPRSNYDMIDLGPSIFRIGDECKTRFERTDIDLYNMRNMNIKCSWFRPLNQEGKLPCVVYCHANCGGRYDGLEALFLLTHGFTLFCFDFCGSGMSEGEYISLGFYERQDLATVTEYLSLQPDVDGIALWGRSMGAVTSIMYASKDQSIRCVICDSPFGSLRWLVRDLVADNGGRTVKLIPSAVINSIVERIRKRIMKRAAFDIDDLNTIKYASQCHVPGLLFHGKDDNFVNYKHSMAVRDAFQASCLHMLVPDGHNDERGSEIHELIVGYLKLYMIEKPKAERENQLAGETPGPTTGPRPVTALHTHEVRTFCPDVKRKDTKQDPSAGPLQGSVVRVSPTTSSTTRTTTKANGVLSAVEESHRPTVTKASSEVPSTTCPTTTTTTEAENEAPPVGADDNVSDDSLLDFSVDVDPDCLAKPIQFSKIKMSNVSNEPATSTNAEESSPQE